MRPRRINDIPQQVPADLWECDAELNTSSVYGNGLTIDAVRIVSARSLSANNEQTIITKISPKRGPRSTKVDIFNAYQELSRLQRLDFTTSLRSNCDVIRNYLISKHPDKSGIFSNLHYETIRKAIGDDFKAASKTK